MLDLLRMLVKDSLCARTTRRTRSCSRHARNSCSHAGYLRKGIQAGTQSKKLDNRKKTQHSTVGKEIPTVKDKSRGQKKDMHGHQQRHLSGIRLGEREPDT